MKLRGLIVLAVGVFAWSGSQALAQQGIGGIKGLPGAVQKDVGTAVQEEIGGVTGTAPTPAAKAGAAKDAAATGGAAVKGADDSGAGMKGAAPAPAPADDDDEGGDDTE
jgi:hypothetical protein